LFPTTIVKSGAYDDIVKQIARALKKRVNKFLKKP